MGQKGRRLGAKGMEKVNAFLPLDFTVRLAFSNPRALRPEGKPRARETWSWGKRTG